MTRLTVSRILCASAAAGVLALAVSFGAAVHAQAPAPPQVPTYGTNKPEFWFNPFEESAARAVRGDAKSLVGKVYKPGEMKDALQASADRSVITAVIDFT